MDKFVSQFSCEVDDDLAFCDQMAYQISHDRVPDGENAEGENYYDHYMAVVRTDLAKKLHKQRRTFVDWHVGEETKVLDVGVGCGQFIETRSNTYGFDVNPKAVEWLKTAGYFRSDFSQFRAFTFWDVIEHIPDPAHYFCQIAPGSYLFTCLPIFMNIRDVRQSKHYKPGEHLYYWTAPGFINWMGLHGFHLLERGSEEPRESIASFAFRKCRT